MLHLDTASALKIVSGIFTGLHEGEESEKSSFIDSRKYSYIMSFFIAFRNSTRLLLNWVFLDAFLEGDFERT